MNRRFLGALLLVGCGSSGASNTDAGPDASSNDAALDVAVEAQADAAIDAAADASDGAAGPTVAFLNVKANQELATGFVIGQAAATVTQVGCQFDGGAVVVASGTSAWKCARPPSWKIGSQHVVKAGAWDDVTLSSTVTATVYAAQNHDFNGDGYPDVAIGAPFASSNYGSVSIYYGSKAGIGSTADVTVAGATGAPAMFGYTLVVTDLRGTGYADLVVGVASYATWNSSVAKLYVYNGGSTGVQASTSYTLAGPALANISGGYSLAAGDYNGDGFQDIVVGYGVYNGTVSFYLGGSNGAAFDTTKTGSSNQALGTFVGFGDFYGTGYAAAAIATASGTLIFQGGASGIAATSSTTLTESGALNTAYVQRSGYADLAITGNAQAVIHYGSSTGFSSTTTTITDPPAYGWGTVIAGDVDRDGHDDVVFANPCHDSSCKTGAVSVYLGSATGLATSATTSLSNPGTNSEFGYSLGMEDLDADGAFDLLVGTNSSTTYVYYGTGTASVFPSTPSTTVTGLFDVAFSQR